MSMTLKITKFKLSQVDGINYIAEVIEIHDPNWFRRLLGDKHTTVTRQYIGHGGSWRHYPGFERIVGPHTFVCTLEGILTNRWLLEIDKEEKERYKLNAERSGIVLPERI